MAAFLLDTNVISELVKPQPEPKVIAWLGAKSADELFLSVITIGEIARGIARLPQGRKRTQLTSWLEQELPTRFQERILPFDQHSARLWGHKMGEADRLGHPFAADDARIAAIAFRYTLTLATRNTRDFAAMVVTVVNPWTD